MTHTTGSKAVEVQLKAFAPRVKLPVYCRKKVSAHAPCAAAVQVQSECLKEPAGLELTQVFSRDQPAAGHNRE
jgi:hypothetical protein